MATFVIGWICALLLAGVFVVSAVSFLANPWRTVDVVQAMGLPLAAPFAVLAASAEIAVVTLLVLAPSIGGAVAAAYLVTVTVAMGGARLSGAVIGDCSCFAGQHAVDRGYFVRNGGMITIAFAAAAFAPSGLGPWGFTAAMCAVAIAATSVVIRLNHKSPISIRDRRIVD